MWQLFLATSDGYLIAMAMWLLVLGVSPKLLLTLRRRWKGQPRRQNWVKGGLAAWFVCGLLTCIELGFALLYDTSDSFDMTNVSHRWFQVHVLPDMKPLAFQDGTGIEFRDDKEFPATLADNVRHMVFLGDSFTFGHGVPDVRNRFSNRLGQQLKTDATLSQRWVVSNLSKPGSDLLWGDAVLTKISSEPGRRVDVAVYVMCLNDIEAFHPQFMNFNNQVSALRSPPGLFLVRDTYFLNWAYYRGLLLAQADVRNYYDFVKDYYSGPPWQGFVTQLNRVAGQCRENDVELCVAIFPFLHNLRRDYPFQAVHQQIAEQCERLKIPCVDLLPALQPHAAEGLTVNPFDAHPNERAHELVATYLREKLPVFDTPKTDR